MRLSFPLGFESREEALHQKLATYLTFVVSGQLETSYPEHAGIACEIWVLGEQPSPEMRCIKEVHDRDGGYSIPVEFVSNDELVRRMKK